MSDKDLDAWVKNLTPEQAERLYRRAEEDLEVLNDFLGITDEQSQAPRRPEDAVRAEWQAKLERNARRAQR